MAEKNDAGKHYKDTLNLPKTSFPMKADLAKREPETLARWDQEKLYEKVLKKNEGKPAYFFHDGPPYANGHIHLGHALNKILKDIVVKYKNMTGFRAEFRPGWDCHGLPIELQVEQSLKGSKKEHKPSDVIVLCREYAKNYVDIQRAEFRRLGVLADWDHPYLTMSPDYEASILRALQAVVERGYVYRGKKPVYWCASCRTALAEAEVEYEEKQSPSITVLFGVKKAPKELDSFKDAFIAVWTTTPWTLPANMAIAVHPDYEYALLQTPKGNVLVAEGLLEQFAQACSWETKQLKVLSRFKGKKLKGLVCSHPFIDRESPVILAYHVTLDEGTGCVHTAPGHGQEDYVVGVENGLPVYTPVDEEGNFLKEVPHVGGLFVFDADPVIISLLEEKKRLLAKGTIVHSYPHCWRCKRPVIFRGTEQWFLSVLHKDLRNLALSTIEEVEWVPSWGNLRIRGMIENRPDWCLSRQRIWGVPIPALTCKACKETFLSANVIQKLANKVERYGVTLWFEESLEEIFEGEIACEKCGAHDLEKGKDILDVWFDSGASGFSVLGKEAIPADLYLEGSDQHRGWFQTTLLLTLSASGKKPYKRVLTHGFTLDGEGKKMSKSLGNVIDPSDVTDKQGADVLRLWVASEDYRNDMRCSPQILDRVSEVYRRVRNTFRFMLGNLSDFHPDRDTLSYEKLAAIDRWVLHKWTDVVQRTRAAYETFNFHTIYHAVQNFCAVDLSAEYFDILKDRLYVSYAMSSERRSTQTVLWHLAHEMSRLMAPILSFTTEEVWAYLPMTGKESLFLEALPEQNPRWRNPSLHEEWVQLFSVRVLILKALERARAERAIGNALEAKVVLSAKDEGAQKLLQKYEKELAAIFIVSQVSLKSTEAKPIVEMEEGPLKVSVLRAVGGKCPRCWMVSESVDEKKHPLCLRCGEVIQKIEK